jgi:hypothetical protein
MVHSPEARSSGAGAPARKAKSKRDLRASRSAFGHEVIFSRCPSIRRSFGHGAVGFAPRSERNRIHRKRRAISLAPAVSEWYTTALLREQTLAQLKPPELASEHSDQMAPTSTKFGRFDLGRDGRTTRASGCRSSNTQLARGAPSAGAFFSASIAGCPNTP